MQLYKKLTKIAQTLATYRRLENEIERQPSRVLLANVPSELYDDYVIVNGNPDSIMRRIGSICVMHPTGVGAAVADESPEYFGGNTRVAAGVPQGGAVTAGVFGPARPVDIRPHAAFVAMRHIAKQGLVQGGFVQSG
jgi:hypothetical protein